MAQAKRPSPGDPPRSLAEIEKLNLETSKEGEDIDMRDLSEDSQGEQPRKRPAVGDGISAGSGSPRRRSPSPLPRRSRARQSPDSDNQRPPVANPQLWTADRIPYKRTNFVDPQLSSTASQAKPSVRSTGPSKIYTSRTGVEQMEEELKKDAAFDIVREPETRPISQEQLVAEVKGIYAGLVMVEAKCIEVDNKQAALAQQGDPASLPKLNNEQWQALIALHRTLLHEHHDFFLASQHPSASPALRRLASKYAMPARMWRHGIHSFLELLRHRLPASLDHMLAFIYLAYSMMALLYETVPAFEDTWIECLGDLGRYRMAIEDDDIRDRDVWTGVARHWYSKASDNAPNTGRLYHHLAILARPNALLQLFYYTKSLCVAVPFSSARESILTLFEPVLNATSGQGQYRLPPFDTAFVKAHGLLFTNKNMDKFRPAVQEFLDLLNNHIGRVTRKFLEQGYYIAVSNIIAMLGYGAQDNPLMIAMDDASQNLSDPEMAVKIDEKTMESFQEAQYLATEVIKIVLKRIGDPNILPFIHVTLAFMKFMSRRPRAMQYLAPDFPWQLLVETLNPFMAAYPTPDRIEDDAFPVPVKDRIRPFTEDFAMRGLTWAEGYFPPTWFSDDKLDDEERHLEVASMADVRSERIVWLAYGIADAGSWISYDRVSRRFSTTMDVPPLDSRVSTFMTDTSTASVVASEELVDVRVEIAEGEEESDTESHIIEENKI